ncbi:hypothetical protein PSTG_19885, partial [Puccinia striiformis f. sp. tritici PST-78]
QRHRQRPPAKYCAAAVRYHPLDAAHDAIEYRQRRNSHRFRLALAQFGIFFHFAPCGGRCPICYRLPAACRRADLRDRSGWRHYSTVNLACCGDGSSTINADNNTGWE